MINKSNYEAFALDYLEGTLSVTERRAMEAFLQQHPTIAEEMRSLEEMVTLVPDETVVFEHKNMLLKSEGGARIVAMHRRTWFRTLIAAAAMLFLIGGYLAGYFTNNTEGTENLIVRTPVEKEEKLVPAKEIDVLANEENIEAVIPDEKKIPEVNTPKKTINANNQSTKKYNDVATTTPPKTKMIPVEKPDLEKTIQQNQPLEKEENTAVAIEDNQSKKSEEIPQPLLTPDAPDSEITIATLPEKTIEANETPASKVMEEIGTELPQPTAIADNTEIEKEINEEKQGKKTLRKIGRFFGKLPFEGATASIIPSYYRDKKNEGK